MAGDNNSQGLGTLTDDPTSAATPLDQLGLDPDDVRANPDLLRQAAARNQPVEYDSNGYPYAPGQDNAKAAGDPRLVTRGPVKPIPGVNTPYSAADFGVQGLSAAMTPPAPPAPPQAQPSVTAQAGGTTAPAQTNNAPASYPMGPFVPESGAGLLRTAGEQEGVAKQDLDPSVIQRRVEGQAAVDKATKDLQGINPADYKPTGWQRFGRGVRGGVIGLLTGGIPGAAIGAIEPQDIEGGRGYSDPTKKYDATVQQANYNLTNAQRTQKDLLDNLKAAEDARKAASESLNKSSDAYKGAGTIGTDTQKNAVQQQEAINNSPESKLKLSQDEFTQRIKQADSQGLKGVNRIFYTLTGKIPDPRNPSEGEITAGQVARATSIWSMQHGGKQPATLEDFNDIQQAARGQMGKGKANGGKLTDGEIATANRDKETKRLQARQTYLENKIKFSGNEAQDLYEKQLQDIENSYAAQLGGQPMTVKVDENGQESWSGGGAPSAAPPAAAPPQQAQNDPPAPPDAVQTYRDPKTRKVMGWLLKDGTKKKAN